MSAANASGPTDQARQAALDGRVATVPNAVTLIRLVLIPVFVWLLFGRDDRGSAAILLAILGSTDWVDGWIARRFNQGSTLGKILDPATDRVLLGTAIISLFVDGSVPKWVFAVVLAREAVVSGATLALAAAGARRIDVQWVGKAGTFGLMVALPCFLAGASQWGTAHGFRIAAWLWLVPSLVLAYWAAASYVPIARRALAEGRALRHSGS